MSRTSVVNGRMKRLRFLEFKILKGECLEHQDEITDVAVSFYKKPISETIGSK